jgi:hypothetical protein
LLRVIGLWLLLGPVSPSTGPSAAQVQTTASLTQNDRRVITALLTSRTWTTSGRLLDSTMPLCQAEVNVVCIPANVLGDVSPSAWRPGDVALRADFLSRNKAASSLGAIKVGLRLTRSAQTRPLLSKSLDWRVFSSKFPGVTYVVQVSAPGYSSDGNRALVYWRISCGGRCGSLELTALERTPRGWIVDRTLMYGIH